MAGFEIFLEVAEYNATNAQEEAENHAEKGVREGIPGDMWRSLE